MKLFRKKSLKNIIVCGLLVALVISGIYIVISCNAIGKTYDDLNDIPYRRYALLLGTSPITPSGGYNFYFNRRIDAAVELYNSGKISRIIASGGDYRGMHKYGCNELTAMCDSLVKRGMPADSIILDYGGTRTINSIMNARQFTDSVTLISQEYHNERALYLSKHYNLNAIAYNAKTPKSIRKRVRNISRELLARIKMLLIDL